MADKPRLPDLSIVLERGYVDGLWEGKERIESRLISHLEEHGFEGVDECIRNWLAKWDDGATGVGIPDSIWKWYRCPSCGALWHDTWCSECALFPDHEVLPCCDCRPNCEQQMEPVPIESTPEKILRDFADMSVAVLDREVLNQIRALLGISRP